MLRLATNGAAEMAERQKFIFSFYFNVLKWQSGLAEIGRNGRNSLSTNTLTNPFSPRR
jgi:hypothetical protein